MRVKLHAKHDRQELRAALDAAGRQGVQIVEEGGNAFIEVPDGEDVLAADQLAQRTLRRTLVQRIRQAGTQAALREALADAFELLFKL